MNLSKLESQFTQLKSFPYNNQCISNVCNSVIMSGNSSYEAYMRLKFYYYITINNFELVIVEINQIF